ncbi:hypothetical protein GCM10010123_30990 [Pilimelia anulata]|uniref:Uncharacterized protein n=1 Tax=Pilimelia anulata TaxID=53371 RepID=A0A8J3BEU3_9ACTN|nr:hypothetical protein GCM10010123_30990 [Pilimelia anulata]
MAPSFFGMSSATYVGILGTGAARPVRCPIGQSREELTREEWPMLDRQDGTPSAKRSVYAPRSSDAKPGAGGTAVNAARAAGR